MERVLLRLFFLQFYNVIILIRFEQNKQIFEQNCRKKTVLLKKRSGNNIIDDR